MKCCSVVHNQKTPKKAATNSKQQSATVVQQLVWQTSEQIWQFKATNPALYKNSVHRNSNAGREFISFGPAHTIIKYAAVKAIVGQYADISGQSATRSSKNNHKAQMNDQQ